MSAESGTGLPPADAGREAALLAKLAEATAAGDFEAREQITRELAQISEARRGLKQPSSAATVPPVNSGAIVPASSSAPRNRKTRSVKAPPAAPEPMHLPAWAERQRGMPNELIRSALFAVTANSRKQLKDQAIAGTSQRLITYSGEELRVSDEDVLLQIYHFQRGEKLGQPFTVTAGEFLDRLGKPHGAREYTELYKSLHRLAKGNITITDIQSEDSYELQSGPILADLVIHHSTKGQAKWIQITLSPRTDELWRSMGYTLLDWGQRSALSRPLSKALHRYYASHRDPFPIKVETIRRMMGSETASIVKFRQLLKQSLDDLVNIGFLVRYWIDSTDKVNVLRTDAAAGQLAS